MISGPATAQGIPPDASWHLQLSGKLYYPDRDLYDIDLFDHSKETISKLKLEGRIVICYLSAGSFEDWRPDAEDFPENVKGDELAGWPGERWLDVRDPVVLEIMKARMDLAVEKGCDGVDPDNVNGHSNDTGFDLTADDLISYNLALSSEAKERGLFIGLKNTLDLIGTLEPHYDFALNESCYKYNECDLLKPFVESGKPVFIAEYRSYNKKLCQKARTSGYQLQFFNKKLNKVGKPCT